MGDGMTKPEYRDGSISDQVQLFLRHDFIETPKTYCDIVKLNLYKSAPRPCHSHQYKPETFLPN
jgi:hypothetical protein